MRAIYVSGIILALFVFALFVFAETPEEYKVKDSDYNFEVAMENLTKVEKALKDFRDFSEIMVNDEVLKKINSGEAANINIKINTKDLAGMSDNLNWSTQNIGFHNWMIIIRGSLLKSNWLEKELKYELEKNKGKKTAKELQDLKRELDIAHDEYQRFLSNATYSD